MARVHRRAMKLLSGPVRAAFLDTPAGFQLNSDAIAAKAVEYFRTRLSVDLTIASYRAADTATDAEVQAAVEALYHANYVFAGPGSPTYAIRHWRGTPVFDAMLRVLARGGCLAFASAAALTVGRLAIPVYEIYKVGETPHWVDGLDILGRVGLEACVVPHWNNQSGGDHDTARCFIGEPRWRALEAQLPPSTAVLGIDEHTTCILRLDAGIAEVCGRGAVTIRRDGQEHRFGDGDAFPLDLLQAGAVAEAPPAPLPADNADSPEQISQSVYRLLEALREARERQDWAMVSQVEASLREALLGLIAAMPPPVDPQATVIPYLNLLVAVRDDLRAARLWPLADRIRTELLELGIEVSDTATGSIWRFANA